MGATPDCEDSASGPKRPSICSSRILALAESHHRLLIIKRNQNFHREPNIAPHSITCHSAGAMYDVVNHHGEEYKVWLCISDRRGRSVSLHQLTKLKSILLLSLEFTSTACHTRHQGLRANTLLCLLFLESVGDLA